MNIIKLATAAAVLLSSISAAQAFDWSSQLQKSPEAFEAALGSTATCEKGGYSIQVKFVDADTKIAPILDEPVVNTGFKHTLINPADISVSRDEDRWFRVGTISRLTCLIGREATATAYVLEDKIFRIGLLYDRCETRKPEKSIVFDNVTFTPCRGADVDPKPFDTALYDQVISKLPNGDTRDYGWAPFSDGEYAKAERALVFLQKCDGTDDTRRRLSERSDSWRCRVAIDNADLNHWSAATMFEFYDKGYFYDDVKLRLASTRMFVDIPAQQKAVEALLPGLQAMVDGIKAEIATRVADKAAKDGAVSDILGAGN